MRAWLPIVVATLLVMGAFAARAAPTCQDRSGDTMRCGVAGAMPVGWTPSPQARLARDSAASADPTAEVLLNLVCVLGGLFALIALMPAFDGWRPGDWGRQEGDDEDRP